MFAFSSVLSVLGTKHDRRQEHSFPFQTNDLQNSVGTLLKEQDLPIYQIYLCVQIGFLYC